MAAEPRPEVSVLWPHPESAPGRTGAAPAPGCFRDLNLDQVVKALTGSRPGYDIEAFFYRTAPSTDVVNFRQAVAKDLQRQQVRQGVDGFAAKMRSARGFLGSAAKLDDQLFKQAWSLDAAEAYSQAVACLAEALEGPGLASSGLRALRDFLDEYLRSGPFTYLSRGVERLRAKFAAIEYTTYIRARRVTVDVYHGEADYSAQVEELFAKFRQGAVKDYRSRYRDFRDTNHVQGWVLEQLARLYPEPFGDLATYCSHISGFIDPTVAAFDTEVQFYLSYLDMADDLHRSGLDFCYPEVAPRSAGVDAEDAFDLALALAHAGTGREVVTNDVKLAPGETVLVVTGPNQGGKTTFARTFGQLHYLAGLGLPVPGGKARLPLADCVFTHFEREETFEDLHGKLEEELVRVHEMLGRASPQSVVIMNESFSSTSLSDNRFIGSRVLQAFTDLGALCVYVTFVDELSRLNDHVVSMVSEVVAGDARKRTFKVRRRVADGRAYAHTLAERYGLTYAALSERMTARQ